MTQEELGEMLERAASNGKEITPEDFYNIMIKKTFWRLMQFFFVSCASRISLFMKIINVIWKNINFFCIVITIKDLFELGFLLIKEDNSQL